MDCIFCSIVSGDAPSEQIYADDDTVAFLDIAQATRGHTLIVPREHRVDLLDIGADIAAAVARATVNVAAILERALHPAGINTFHATRAAAWQTVFHFHVHVVPRYDPLELNLPWIPRPKPFEALRDLAEQIRAT